MQLESNLNDREITIKIQKEKIKILEEAQLMASNGSNFSNGCNPATSGSYNPSYHHCSHPYPHCTPTPHYHCSHHSSTSHSFPHSQPETNYNQKLEEIKKSVDNVTACVLGIADAITKPTDITANNVSTHEASEKTRTNRAVNTTNEADNLTHDSAGNNSMVSFDGSVPDLPSLNSQNPTSQLQQLMLQPQPELTQIPSQ